MKLFAKTVRDELVDDDKSSMTTWEKILKIIRSKVFIISVGVVVLLILLIVLRGVFKSQKSGLDYYDTMTSIFTNELGSFSYTLSVETGDKGKLITEVTLPDIEELEPDSEAVDPNQTKPSKQFADWDKYSEIQIDNWRHPVYRVSVVGTTMSLDPLQTNFTVTLATPVYNAKFTEVTVRDDMYYVDVESIYNWLSNSQDSYLMKLVGEIPHGSKWLEIPASEFAIPSRYAELGDEQTLSEAHSLVTLYRRFLVALKTAIQSTKGVLGNTGVDAGQDIVKLTLSGSDATKLVSAVKSISSRSGDFYDSVINTAASSGLYNENQKAQAMREKDNFIEAMHDLAVSSQLCNPDDLKVMASGHVRKYTNGYGNAQVEGSFATQFSTDDTDFILKFIGVRSGDQRDIIVPDGSKTSENATMYLDCLNKIMDYFNFTNIKLDTKLSVNPDTIADGIYEKFINLVNNTGTAGYWVTRDNVSGYIETYRNMKQSDAQTEDELKNILLVSDLIAALDEVVPRDGVAVVTNPEPVVVAEPEKFPDVTVMIAEGLELRTKYNVEESNHGILVLDCEVLNKTDAAVTLNSEDFSVHDLLASVFPANNETLIRNYDNVFDMSKLATIVEVGAKTWGSFKLYFVIPNDNGHMDLFYGDKQLGAVIQF